MLFSAWIIALAIAIQQPAVSPQAERLIAPVVEAVRTEQARQAASGPPIDLNERFLRMYRLDQQSRAALNMVDLSTLPPAERQQARAAMWKIIGEIDEANQEALLEALPPEELVLSQPLRRRSCADCISHRSALRRHTMASIFTGSPTPRCIWGS